jgi:hypothetical protein
MYPARFEYFAPTTVEEAVSILERYGDEAKVLAGGQSLIPLMKLRFASPRALVDINRIAGLDELYEDNDRRRRRGRRRDDGPGGRRSARTSARRTRRLRRPRSESEAR